MICFAVLAATALFLPVQPSYFPSSCRDLLVICTELMRRPVNATVRSIEGKSFVDGQVSWNSIGFSTAGVYRVKFHASSSLPESTFNLSSDMGMVEVLPSGLPATLHILQQPSNAAPVKPRSTILD